MTVQSLNPTKVQPLKKPSPFTQKWLCQLSGNELTYQFSDSVEKSLECQLLRSGQPLQFLQILNKNM